MHLMNSKCEPLRFHHVGIAVKSLADAAAQYEKALGIGLITEIVEDEIQKVRVGFCQVGPASFVEFVEPTENHSPVSNMVKRGGGPYHICYRVPDIEVAIQRVRQAGWIVVSGPVPARAFGGRRITFVYTPTDRTLIEFVEDNDPLSTLLELR